MAITTSSYRPDDRTAPGGVCRADCDQLVADAWVCNTCVHRLRVALDDVGDLLDELDIDITRQGRRGDRVGGRSVERPLPFDPTASIMRDALTDTLRTWCRDLLSLSPAGSGHGLATLLSDRLADVRQHPDGGTLVDEVTAVVNAARDQVHGRDRASSALAGYCPTCGAAVYARPQAATARCRTCHEVVDAADWRRRALAAVGSEAMTAANAARALTTLGHPVSADRIRQWAKRRKLSPVSADPLGRPLYLVADVRDLITP